MENEKVYFTISVNEDTAKQIRYYSDFMNRRNSFLENKKAMVTDEDIIKAALFQFFEILDKYYEFENPDNIQLSPKSKIKNKFREIAMREGIDQSTISKVTGIERANISRVFNNRNQPSMDYFFRIWLALERPPIEELFYEEIEE